MARRYVDHYLADAAALVRTLTTDFAALQKRLALWSRDGYPTGQSGTRTKGAVGDPTALAVIASDDIRKDRDRLTSLIIQAHENLKEADMIRARYMTTTSTATIHNATLTKCANMHGCPEDMWAAKAGRCLNCCEYQRRNQRDRVG